MSDDTAVFEALAQLRDANEKLSSNPGNAQYFPCNNPAEQYARKTTWKDRIEEPQSAGQAPDYWQKELPYGAEPYQFVCRALWRLQQQLDDVPPMTVATFRQMLRQQAFSVRPLMLDEAIALARGGDADPYFFECKSRPIDGSLLTDFERRLCAPKLASPEVQAEDFQADGPVPPKHFRLNGQLHEMKSIPWRLVFEMWDVERLTESEIVSKVWGASETSDSNLKSTLNRANESLRDIGYRRFLSKSNGYIFWT